MWWVREYLLLNPYGRPLLVYFRRGRNIEISGVKFMNSPRFHIKLRDMDGVYCHDFEIYTDTKGQENLNQLLGGEKFTSSKLRLTVPIFPLNTDGLDPSGANILIERLNITCFDDAVAIKPAH